MSFKLYPYMDKIHIWASGINYLDYGVMCLPLKVIAPPAAYMDLKS